MCHYTTYEIKQSRLLNIQNDGRLSPETHEYFDQPCIWNHHMTPLENLDSRVGNI